MFMFMRRFSISSDQLKTLAVTYNPPCPTPRARARYRRNIDKTKPRTSRSRSVGFVYTYSVYLTFSIGKVELFLLRNPSD